MALSVVALAMYDNDTPSRILLVLDYVHVIKFISFQVRTHNHMVEMLTQAADSCPHEQLHRHILADSNKVFLPEVSDSNSAVENFSK